MTLKENMTYDSMNRMACVSKYIVRNSYQYDNNELKDGSPQTSTYSYDKLSRLTDVKRADGTETAGYSYDLRGNRLTQKDTRDLPDGLRWKKTGGNKVTQYSYNGADQVIGDQTSNETISSYIRGDRVLVKKDLTNQKDYYYLSVQWTW